MKIERLLNKKICEFPVQEDTNRPEPHAAIGIEVEIERVDASREFKYWTVARDGSLQRGIELISLPVWGTAIDDALIELNDFLIQNPPYISFRTSTHVHVNVLDLDTLELKNLIILYLLYEPALFRIHQEWNRYENIFCMPAAQSFGILRGYSRLLSDLSHEGVGSSYVQYKYSALNPNSIGSLGTVEFRHMGGISNTSKLDFWINILLQLKWAAKNINIKDSQNPDKVWGRFEKQLIIKKKDLDNGTELLEYINLQ